MAFKRSGVRLPLAPTNKIKGLSRAIAFVSNQLATKLRERLISVSSASNARSQARSGLLPDGRSPARLVRPTERRARDQWEGLGTPIDHKLQINAVVGQPQEIELVELSLEFTGEIRCVFDAYSEAND